jgi:hypothetical protein
MVVVFPISALTWHPQVDAKFCPPPEEIAKAKWVTSDDVQQASFRGKTREGAYLLGCLLSVKSEGVSLTRSQGSYSASGGRSKMARSYTNAASKYDRIFTFADLNNPGESLLVPKRSLAASPVPLLLSSHLLSS